MVFLFDRDDQFWLCLHCIPIDLFRIITVSHSMKLRSWHTVLPLYSFHCITIFPWFYGRCYFFTSSNYYYHLITVLLTYSLYFFSYHHMDSSMPTDTNWKLCNVFCAFTTAIVSLSMCVFHTDLIWQGRTHSLSQQTIFKSYGCHSN